MARILKSVFSSEGISAIIARFMNRLAAFLLVGVSLTAAPLSAKTAKGDSDIARARDAAGAGARFDRLETVAAQANLVYASTAGVVHQPFAIEARRLPSGEWSVHERMGDRDALWSAPGMFYRPSAMNETDRARERFFLLLAPDHLARAVAGAPYVGLGHFQGRLCRRLEIKNPSVAESWTVYLDTDTHRLRGLRAAGGEAWLLEEEELFQNQFSLATRWIRFSPEGEKMEIVQLMALAFNVFLTDFKGAAPAEPLAAPISGDKR